MAGGGGAGRRARQAEKKKARRRRAREGAGGARGGSGAGPGPAARAAAGDQAQLLAVGEADPELLGAFSEVFRRFEGEQGPGEGGAREGGGGAAEVGPATLARGAAGGEAERGAAAGAGGAEAEDSGPQPLSKKRRKVLSRPSVAELKLICRAPEVVEVWDTTGPDPELLVNLKARRNSVPVPSHWSSKRHFLQGKRGLEKPPFELPKFIADTGISDMRGAAQEKADSQRLKEDTRARVKPKMGKMDLDFQVLHDAFFRFQTKPKLSGLGEVYYEGKEFETQAKGRRPGAPLSDELRQALSMGEGGPPPWLVNMQRYGPPPSYPGLKVPGLNAPIPEGASYGYHAGGWGKPPVDESGKPLYGNPFSVSDALPAASVPEEMRTPWGALEEDDFSESDSEGASGEGFSGDDSDFGEDAYGGAAPSEMGDLEVPVSKVDLRKAEPGPQGSLYKVLDMRKTAIGTAAAMGSEHQYVMPPAAGEGEAGDAEAVEEPAAPSAPVGKLSASFKF